VSEAEGRDGPADRGAKLKKKRERTGKDFIRATGGLSAL
jgi:hypothetical protein